MKVKETDCKYTYWEDAIKMFYKRQEWQRRKEQFNKDKGKKQ